MIKTDSRRVRKGDIFVALPGIKSDGHDYIDDAIKNGASSVIVTHGNYSVDTVVVDDTKEYLKDYLFNNYSDIINDMIIIGVTGTNGKTTVSHLIYQALNKLGVKCSMIGTLGYYKDNKIGDLYNTSPDLAMMYELLIDSYNSGYRCVVVEASSQGLYEDRFFGISFDYALFTNISQDHLDYHKDFKHYVAAKTKLFLKLKKDGIGIVNADDSYSSWFCCNNRITYGFSESDYRILCFSNGSFDFYHNNIYKVFHNLVGKYNIYNLMCSIVLLECMGFKYEQYSSIFKEIFSPKGRMEIYNYLDNRIIVDYAHTPDAVKNVISSIDSYNKIYAVFGCTGSRDRIKRPIMTRILIDACDYVVITSDDLYDESFENIVNDMIAGIVSHNYCVCRDRGLAIKKGISLLNSNDVLLVLGKGHEEFIKVGSERIPFNDGKFIFDFISKSI